MMKEPAIANEEISTPKTPRSGVPMNKNAHKIRKDTTVTLTGWTMPTRDFISIIIGIDPRMSIMANSTRKAAKISLKLKSIICNF
jgi:hypothetical protein